MWVTSDTFQTLVGAYRTSCATPTTCTVRVGGAAVEGATTLDAWFAAARAGDPNARKNFEMMVFAYDGSPSRRFQVTNGIPIELTHQNARFQLVLKADRIERVA